MNTRTLLTTALTTTVIAGFLSFTSIAQAGQNCSDKGAHAKYSEASKATKAERIQNHPNKMASKLGLNDEQKIQLQTLKKDTRDKIKSLRHEKCALRQEIRQLDPSASEYTEKLADVANRQAELTRQMIIAKGNKRQQITLILTPEQLVKKAQLRAKRKAKFHQKKKGQHKKQQQS